MSGGMSFTAGRDMPMGMQEKLALQIAAELQTAPEQCEWVPVRLEKPELFEKKIDDGEDAYVYYESDPVLGFDGVEMAVIHLVKDDAVGEKWYVYHDGASFAATHWWRHKLPAPPEEN